MKCQNVMTKNPNCCLPDDTVGQAARLMRHEHIGSVPVISDERSRMLVGIVTQRDLVAKVIAEKRDPSHTEIFEVMTRTIVACRNDDDVDSALAAMEDHNVRRLPVIDQDGRVVGIISKSDTNIFQMHPPTGFSPRLFRAA